MSPALGLSLLYGALFLYNGVQLTYLPVWLDARGLSALQISVASSAPAFLRLAITPALAFAADRAERHREYMIGLAWVGLALLVWLSQARDRATVALLVVPALIAMHSIMPLLDTIAMRAARKEGLDYGRTRLWGSLTFILASYAAAFASAHAGAEAVIWLLIGGAASTALAAHLLSPSGDRPQAQVAPSRPRLTLADVRGLAGDRRFALFLIACGAIQASHATFYTFGVLHWRGHGLSAGAIGTLWALSVLAEVALFWAGRRLVLASPLLLILAGGAAGIVRWGLMPLDLPVAALVPLQLLHALTFGATHLGAMHWIATAVPEHKAGTAQALLSTFTSGVAMAGATLASGPLYHWLGGNAFLAMALLSAIGLAAGLALWRGGRKGPDAPG